MASSVEFVEYVVDQIGFQNELSYRKMFGEFALYYNGKHFAFVSNDQLLIKKTASGIKIMPDAEDILLFEGAIHPMMLIEEFENRERLQELVLVTCSELPDKKIKL